MLTLIDQHTPPNWPLMHKSISTTITCGESALTGPVLFDDRWCGNHGIGRFATEIRARIRGLTPVPHTLRHLHPLDSFWLSSVIVGRGARAYFTPGYNPPLPTRVPLVMTVHDLNYLFIRENSNVVRRAYFRTIVKAGCRRAARILTVSEFSRHQIAEWSGIGLDRIINVSNGVSPVFNPLGPGTTRPVPYFLYVGLRGGHKNLPRLFRAFARARIDHSVQLLLTGAPEHHLQQIAAQEGCGERIVFLGSIPDDELARLYRGAIALLMPSLYEGFGLPAAEAMSCGTPTVASAAGGLAEVCADASLLVDPSNVESITDGIERIIDDEPLRETLRERGFRQAGRFRWDTTVARVFAALADAKHA